MVPRVSLRMHHALLREALLKMIHGGLSINIAAVTTYFRACYTKIEFPRLLAKREIIANALVKGSGFLPRNRPQR